MSDAAAPGAGARWRSEAGVPAPTRIVEVDDTLKADAALRLASEGASLLWTSDFHNARQLLQAMARRIDGKAVKPLKPSGESPQATMRDAFNRHRLAQGQRARLLGRVLVRLEPDRSIALSRAPDVRAACAEAWGPPDGEATLVSLRELLGIVGAHEWRKKGVPIAALAALAAPRTSGLAQGDRIHPHYGVFSPVRGEYLELVAKAPLPSKSLAFDIGTGTGVIAAVLARRGVQRVVATDLDERAIACAADNVQRLGLQDRVELRRADLFPNGRAPLVVCNPPWLPARPSAPLERAVYDEGGAMLRGFIAGLPAHLEDGGEGWLVMSDFAEHLGLRAKGEIESLVDAAGLRVVDRTGTRAHHPKTQDRTDPLHAARAKETTFLYRLGSK